MSIKLLLEDINNGYDGVINKIYFYNNLSSVDVSIATQCKSKNSWVEVCFSITGLLEFRVSQKEEYGSYILDNGICNIIIDGKNYIAFSAPYDEVESVREILESDVYFVGKNISYKLITDHR